MPAAPGGVEQAALATRRTLTLLLRRSPSARDERHHRAQLLHAGPARLDVADELLREGAGPDLLEDLAHLGAHVGVDDARAAREIAVLGGVGDGVAHAFERS